MANLPLAKTYQVAIPSHNYSTTVLGLAVTAQRAAGTTNFVLAEYFVPSIVEGRKFAAQLEAKGSFLQLPTQPGLGVEIDEETLFWGIHIANTHSVLSYTLIRKSVESSFILLP